MGEAGGRRLGALAAIGAAFLLCTGSARAQEVTSSAAIPPGELGWTATGARTVGSGASVAHAEAGWPGINLTYLRGLDDATDAGLRATFNYGFEGTTGMATGLVLQIPVRRYLGGSDTFNLGVHVDPGLAVYDNKGSTLFGATIPLGAVAGIQLSPQLVLEGTLDFPILISILNPLGVLFGPEVGAGAEYKVDRNLAVTVRARIGPEFALANGSGGTTSTAFQTLVGVAYNLR